MSMRELRQLTEQADHEHQEAMRTIHEELGERHLSRQDDEAVATRRSFVRNLGLGGAAVAFGSVLVPVTGLVPAALAQTTAAAPELPAADLVLIVFAHGLELALARSYEDMIATRKLDSQQAQSAGVFSRHHTEHATALAALIPKAQVVTTPNAKVVDLFAPRINRAADAAALMQIGFDLETGAAATYQRAMGALEHWQPSATVATIEPIEAQHAVVWGQALGLPQDQWMPAFQDTAAALDPANYLAS